MIMFNQLDTYAFIVNFTVLCLLFCQYLYLQSYRLIRTPVGAINFAWECSPFCNVLFLLCNHYCIANKFLINK